jgi:alpha-ribazole phosphatase
MKIYWIRHGKTEGNLQGQYMGRMDLPLCDQGIAEIEANIRAGVYPPVQWVNCSPMLRCAQTARIIYPNVMITGMEGFRECDFGAFEGRTNEELKDLPEYQAWVASNGQVPPPGGESKETFALRCKQALDEVIERAQHEGLEEIALVVHGGVIMTLLEQLAVPQKGFFDYQLPNGGCIKTQLQPDGTLTIEE